MAATVDIRPVDSPAEFKAFFHLAAQTFIRDVPVETGAADWQRFATEHPRFHPGGLRGAFRGDAYMGGYIVEERRLQVGSAWVPAGRIGAVVIHPEHRRQGLGTALMRDALDHARARGLALLLLNGAAHFYDPFGYIDIFDRTEHVVACADIRACPASPYRVRQATVHDAPALLALYQRHHSSYACCYDRTRDEQTYLVRFEEEIDRSPYTWRGDIPYDLPVLAVDARDQPRGYLAIPWGPTRSFGCEVACDDWPAALALLQHHAALLATLPDATEHVRWPLPPTSAAAYAIADHVPLSSEQRQRPHAGWMACLLDMPSLGRLLLPEWQRRWQRFAPSGLHAMHLTVEGDLLAFSMDGRGIQLVDHPIAGSVEARISRAVFTQLLFGYRPVTWAAGQDGQQIPSDLLPALEVLFAGQQTWIAPGDGC